MDQVFKVILKHGEKTVGPNDPHEPNTPIDPNDPDGPKWPAKDQYSKDYTSTITYVDEQGNKVADDNVQTSTWTRTLIIDTVTGEVKNPNEAWTADKVHYEAVRSPMIKGYYADKVVVSAKETVQENLNEQVVYRSEIPTVTPNRPGEVTPKKYVPATPDTPTTTPVKEAPETPVISEATETKAAELPQTGDTKDKETLLLGLVLLSGAALIGTAELFQRRKRRK